MEFERSLEKKAGEKQKTGVKKEAEEKPKTKKALIVRVLVGMILFVVAAEGLYFGYSYYEKFKIVSALNKEIANVTLEVNTLEKMLADGDTLNWQERAALEKKYRVNIHQAIGASVRSVEVLEKITKKGEESVYYVVKFNYKADNLDGLLRLVSILYLDSEVYKIKNITADYLQVIIKKG